MSGIVRLRGEAAGWLRIGATAVPTLSAVFSVRGPGAAECLQGVLTNDVLAPGTESLGYGAVLTPKGMIVVDFWIFRRGDAFVLLAPPEGRQPADDLFRRRFPPRLAKVEDLTGEWNAMVVFGAQTRETIGRAGLPWPEGEGHLGSAGDGPDQVLLGRPGAMAPWAALITGPAPAVARAGDRLQEAGALIGGEEHREAARILAGWPALGREIGEKTLPQEVRFDEVGGVSYTKGCYVGQETVARVHFRGHPNRTLRGLLWTDARAEPGAPVTVGGKAMGTLTSVLEVGDRRFGLTLLRREVATGALVTVDGGIQARAVGLPFPADLLAA